jgi:hypothetical protein
MNYWPDMEMLSWPFYFMVRVFEGATPVMDWLIYICWSTVIVVHIANTCIRP